MTLPRTGSLAGVTHPASFHAVFQPRTSSASKGLSVMVTRPMGSLDHPLGGTGAETESAPDALFPSEVAVMTAEPAPIAVARPVLFTEASELLLDQETLRPVRMWPAASLSRALNCVEAPATTLAVAGDTVIEATAGCAVVPEAGLE